MKVSVAICTWNRAKLLDQTLRQMHGLRIPIDVEWEVLVVDNNCTDDTVAVVRGHESRLPIRRIHEPKRGLSHARNCALAEAAGDLILWCDDDVLVDAEWLAAYCKVALAWPGAAYFGGSVDPWYESPPPTWAERNERLVRGPFSLCHRDDGDSRFEQKDAPYGANMGFRLEVLKQFPFNPSLGRSGKQLTGCEETDVIERMQRAGLYGVCVGAAKVRHWVPRTRMTYKYVWDWHVGAGVTETRRTGLCNAVYWGGVPRWAVRRFLTHRLRSWWYRACGDRRWADEFQCAAETLGQIRESRELWRQDRRPQPSLPGALS
jgi:glycosyltransferase involved in cell wall biosynthesis